MSAEPADAQLAAGLAMLHGLPQTGQPSLRWYTIEPPALVLGSAQKPHEVSMAAAAGAGVTVYRRASGGGAVYTASALSLDIALPPEDPIFVADVTESYRWLGEVWVAALGALGVVARLVGVAEARADTAALPPLLKRVCYGGLSPYEVVASGRKLVGLAQRRRTSGALLQSGVYLEWRSADTARLVATTDAERAALTRLLDQRVVGLSDLMEGPPTLEAIIQAFETALARRTGLMRVDAEWMEAEQTQEANFQVGEGSQ